MLLYIILVFRLEGKVREVEMLEVQNLTKKFGENVAVNHVSFVVKEGSIFGFLGRNGAGKSTIFRMILGILTADEGKILYQGKNIQEINTDSIGYLPEEGSLILTYTVLEQCLYYGMLKSMDEKTVKDELLWWLKNFNMVEYMNMKIKDLSKGNRQKIQFIISVLHHPELLILDEPFSGLDPISVEELKKAILLLKKEGVMIIFSSHRMEHVEMLCEDILILDKGDCVLYGNLEEIKSSYTSKELIVTGKIGKHTASLLSSLEGVEEVNSTGDTYHIKVQELTVINKIFRLLNQSEITNFYTVNISLNDIFLDKVGVRYEE